MPVSSFHSDDCFGGVFRGRRILVTGHTGFKGAWLCAWLELLGARVTGFSLVPPTRPALFDQLELARTLDHQTGDLAALPRLRKTFRQAAPEFVFHLAAQPLVRASYADPLGTYQTNVTGTLHLLECLRGWDQPCTAVIVTSDKCYRNDGTARPFREDDPLGGHDPYSASKAAAEIVVRSYGQSYFPPDGPVRLASARAGNCVGGGDWAADRLVPDFVRAAAADRRLLLRAPDSVRPWQHVLEPLSGYLWLAARLAADRGLSRAWLSPAPAYNFGPGADANRTVGEVVAALRAAWPESGISYPVLPPPADHRTEARLLSLDTSLAARDLGWSATWDFTETIRQTAHWYRTVGSGELPPSLARRVTREQISGYTSAARLRGQAWSQPAAEPPAVNPEPGSALVLSS